MEKVRPKVGVGVIIRKDGKILLGKRKNAHGDGSWSFPGGHLEFNEQIEDCAIRETMEEVGITIKNVHIWKGFTNDIFLKENKHYVTLYVIGDYAKGEVKVMESEKCEKWEWFEWNNFPKNLFLPILNLKKIGFDPYL